MSDISMEGVMSQLVAYSEPTVPLSQPKNESKPARKKSTSAYSRLLMIVGLGVISSACSQTQEVQLQHVPSKNPVPIELVLQPEDMPTAVHNCYQIVDGNLALTNEEPQTGSQSFTCSQAETTSDQRSNFLEDVLTSGAEKITLPTSLEATLIQEAQPIQDLSPGKTQVKKFMFTTSQKYLFNGTHNSESRTIGIQISNSASVSEMQLRLISSHETFHVVDQPNVHGSDDPNFKAMSDALNARRTLAAKNYRLAHKDQKEKTRLELKDALYFHSDFASLGSLYRLVDESTYTGSQLGHPMDNERELFASTGSVLRYYPHSFMASVDALGAEDKLFMKDLALHVVRFFGPIETDQDIQRLAPLFNKDLLTWLRN